MAEMTSHEQIKEKILNLQSALLENNPRMPSLLQEIHRYLKNDPAVVTLLAEEEFAIVISGLKAQTQTEIATKISKPTSAAAKKALSKVSTDDLGF